MTHREGLYLSSCECPGCEVQREAILLGSDPSRAATPPEPDILILTPPTSKLTPEQSAAYLASGGTKCPVCGSEVDIQGGSIEIEAGCAWQPITCGSCNSEWTDEYELTGVSNFIPGVKSNEGGTAL